jgi:hypothetical protein
VTYNAKLSNLWYYFLSAIPVYAVKYEFDSLSSTFFEKSSECLVAMCKQVVDNLLKENPR